MAYRLKFSARALRETGEAQEWYETQSFGLGEEFIAEWNCKAVRCIRRASIGAAVLRRMLALNLRRITLSLIRPTRVRQYARSSNAYFRSSKLTVKK